MFKFLPLLGFFNSFFSPIGMISYFVLFKAVKVKLGLFDSLFIVYIVTLLLVNFVFSDFVGTLTTFRFYFGFICFYLYFKSGRNFPVNSIFIFLIIIIPAEALLINTIVSPYNMPNFPSEEMTSHFNPGGYQRPYSFGANSSVSSSILVVMLSMIAISNVKKYAVLVCVSIFSSGSGMISLILLLLLKRKKLFFILLFSLFILALIFSADIFFILDGYISYKISLTYIFFLFEFKLGQISNFFNGFMFYQYLFGNVDFIKDGYGGDFGWLYFILGYGYVSFFLLVCFVLSKVNKRNFIPILIALISTFHYPVIFFLPGQILLGYLMSMKKQN